MNPITPHENEGRKYLLVGGIPVDHEEVEVLPSDASEYYFLHHYTKRNNEVAQYLQIGQGVHTLLGTIHTEGNALVFSEGFDPEVLVGRIHVEIAPSAGNYYTGDWDWQYIDYINQGEFAGWNGDAGCFREKEQSVASLLESKGYTMLNPYGEKEPVLPDRMRPIGAWLAKIYNERNKKEHKEKVKAWRTSEDKRHKFKVAVIEVNHK